jgi:hypothetical protein
VIATSGGLGSTEPSRRPTSNGRADAPICTGRSKVGHHRSVSSTFDSPVLFRDQRRVGSTTSDWFTSLQDAQPHTDSILVIEGLEHGYILLTCPVPVIQAGEATIALLAADLHAVSLLLDGLEEYTLSLWLERHVGGRRVRGMGVGKARLARGPWLMNPWGWHHGPTAPSQALRDEVDAVLIRGQRRISAGVLRDERAARLEAVRSARLATSSHRDAGFFASHGWDYDICEPQVDFEVSPAEAEKQIVRHWLAARA